jgi:hypothetical protein
MGREGREGGGGGGLPTCDTATEGAADPVNDTVSSWMPRCRGSRIRWLTPTRCSLQQTLWAYSPAELASGAGDPGDLGTLAVGVVEGELPTVSDGVPDAVVLAEEDAVGVVDGLAPADSEAVGVRLMLADQELVEEVEGLPPASRAWPVGDCEALGE